MNLLTRDGALRHAIGNLTPMRIRQRPQRGIFRRTQTAYGGKLAVWPVG
jgi:hypothetical protein